MSTIINDLLDDYGNGEDNAMALEGHSNIPVYTAPIMIPDKELHEK